MAFLFLVQKTFATRSISIVANKTALLGNDEMTITASASGFTTGETIYLKGTFYQDGSTNYFGYTKNGDNWIKNGDATINQLPVKIGDWDGTVMVKTDFSDSGYKGEGDYKVKLGFYYTTSTGSLSPVTWSSNAVTLGITEPDPTSTPIPSNTPIPTQKPTSTPTPTPTIVPTSAPTLIPSLKASVSGIAGITPFLSDESTVSGTISLGEEDVSPTPLPEKVVLGEKIQKTNWFWIFILIGMIFLGICGIVLYRMIKNGKDEDSYG